MAEEAGEDNFFMFGLTAEQVAGGRGWYDPRWHRDHEPETRAALDLLVSPELGPEAPSLFAPLRETLLEQGDHYRHPADLGSYLEADRRLCALYADPQGWARKAVLNVTGSGKFSSDRTFAEYAAEAWNARPCPGPQLPEGAPVSTARSSWPPPAGPCRARGRSAGCR